MTLPITRIIKSGEHDLAVCEYGDPAGEPLMQMHGTPGSRYQRFFDESLYEKARFRVVMFDRPGYGRSPRRHGRTVADGVADMMSVADALALDRFKVLGISGGAPYALAAAALRPDRMVACAAVVPPAPMTADIDWYAGMSEDGREDARTAATDESAHAARIQAQATQWMAGLAEGRAPFPVPAPALEVAMQWMPEAWAQGISGSVDDGVACAKHWGCDLATIRVPTSIWSGTEDDACPLAHGQWIARQIKGAKLMVLAGGHMSFMPRFKEILESLQLAG